MCTYTRIEKNKRGSAKKCITVFNMLKIRKLYSERVTQCQCPSMFLMIAPFVVQIMVPLALCHKTDQSSAKASASAVHVH